MPSSPLVQQLVTSCLIVNQQLSCQCQCKSACLHACCTQLLVFCIYSLQPHIKPCKLYKHLMVTNIGLADVCSKDFILSYKTRVSIRCPADRMHKHVTSTFYMNDFHLCWDAVTPKLCVCVCVCVCVCGLRSFLRGRVFRYTYICQPQVTNERPFVAEAASYRCILERYKHRR